MFKTWQLLGRLGFWTVWPVSYVVLSRTRRTRIVILCDNQVLVVKSWIGNGRWGLPGGGIHRGELPEAGLRREVQEEVNITLPAKNVLFLGLFNYKMSGLPYHCYLYGIYLPEQPEVRCQKIEIAAYEWLALEQAAGMYVQPDVLEALHRLAAQG